MLFPQIASLPADACTAIGFCSSITSAPLAAAAYCCLLHTLRSTSPPAAPDFEPVK
jgi:hypothetical protein